MYVTYDLPQVAADSKSRSEPVIRGAKEFTVPGPLVSWEVGEYENASGVKSYALRVEYTDPVIGPAAKYRPALKTAA